MRSSVACFRSGHSDGYTCQDVPAWQEAPAERCAAEKACHRDQTSESAPCSRTATCCQTRQQVRETSSPFPCLFLNKAQIKCLGFDRVNRLNWPFAFKQRRFSCFPRGSPVDEDVDFILQPSGSDVFLHHLKLGLLHGCSFYCILISLRLSL